MTTKSIVRDARQGRIMCPACNSRKNHTLDGRCDDREPIHTRARSCTDCRHRWVTLELPLECLPLELRELAHPRCTAKVAKAP